jgi:hypothetical protein
VAPAVPNVGRGTATISLRPSRVRWSKRYQTQVRGERWEVKEYFDGLVRCGAAVRLRKAQARLAAQNRPLEARIHAGESTARLGPAARNEKKQKKKKKKKQKVPSVHVFVAFHVV